MPRLGLILLLISALFGAAGLPAARIAVVVVSESGVDAYAEALDGVSATLPPPALRIVDASGKTFDRDLAAALEGPEPRAVIAVGSRALAEIRARHIAAPLVAAMISRSIETDMAIRRVDLEVPLAAQLSLMRTLWPGRSRVGIIRDPAQPCCTSGVLVAAARKEGFSAVVVEADGPAHLLKSLSSLKGKVDFVLCFPDPDLYNAVTIKPFVLASLEDRLPLVGYSPAFVRAGASAGIYPDYREIGRQAAEMAEHLLRGEDRAAEESPRKVRVAVNQRVLRLLGVDFHSEALSAEVYR